MAFTFQQNSLCAPFNPYEVTARYLPEQNPHCQYHIEVPKVLIQLNRIA
jgi:hypothetical protein